ncbi:MAG: DnaJ domain-containing protein [Pseudomonadota bacterium]|nr:DnaJ domain-containing protein [Pseudomonadota bacterium]
MRLSECYALLEVPPEATLEEIKVSYRKLAFKYHPDLNPDDAHAAQRFSRLNQAYVLLKDHRARGAEKKTYTAEDIRQEEEARAGTRPGRSDAFFSRQEEVLKDILNDPFARQVFEDIFSRLKRGAPPGDMPGQRTAGHDTIRSKAPFKNPGKSLWAGLKNWAVRQLDDRQIVQVPVRSLRPGTTLRVDIRHRFGEPKSIEVTLPPDFTADRPIRLKGMGRALGPWRGDLYLRLVGK